MQAIINQLEADASKVAMHQTWGHLFPEATTKGFDGTVHVASTMYDGAVVVNEKIDIDGSPWWFAAIHDFASEMERKYMDCGDVYFFNIHVDIVSHLDQADIDTVMEWADDGSMTEQEIKDELACKTYETLVITETANICLVGG